MTTTQQEFGMALATRIAETVTMLADTYRANDTALSVSGSTEGKMRRIGRQDVAVRAITMLLGHPVTPEGMAHVIRMIDEGTL